MTQYIKSLLMSWHTSELPDVMTHSPELPDIMTHSPELRDVMTHSLELPDVITHSSELSDVVTHSPELLWRDRSRLWRHHIIVRMKARCLCNITDVFHPSRVSFWLCNSFVDRPWWKYTSPPWLKTILHYQYGQERVSLGPWLAVS